MATAGSSSRDLSRLQWSPITGTPQLTLSATYASCLPWTTSTIRSSGSASTAQSLKASKWSSTKTRIGSATSADLKDFSSGWPKNSAESPRFHVDRGWTSRGHGRKRGTEGGNLGDFDLRSCAFSARRAVGHESQAARSVRGMEEHPLFEQGDACPAIRLPLQQFEAMDKAFRWPVALSPCEPCLYGRLLFVQMACKCLQFRLAMLLHFFQPPPQPISLALTQQMTKGLHLACRASQRFVGLDQPRPQDAERSCIFD